MLSPRELPAPLLTHAQVEVIRLEHAGIVSGDGPCKFCGCTSDNACAMMAPPEVCEAAGKLLFGPCWWHAPFVCSACAIVVPVDFEDPP